MREEKGVFYVFKNELCSPFSRFSCLSPWVAVADYPYMPHAPNLRSDYSLFHRAEPAASAAPAAMNGKARSTFDITVFV
jgi:hypothetical protein